MARQILVTGCAGFIGYHFVKRLLADGHDVVGVDSLNAYYSVALKEARVASLKSSIGADRFLFKQLDLKEVAVCQSLFADHSFTDVVHLAAQPGVRYSIENPQAYIDSNIIAFFNVIEGCRHHRVGNFIFASSSSVYGNSRTVPFVETQNVDHPISLYAATKKSNELMAFNYAHLYGIPSVGLRFFTVYGPWGRPDMAVYLFADAINRGKELTLFREGTLLRDYTYVDDIVEGIVRLVERKTKVDPETGVPYQIYNIGNHSPAPVTELVAHLERHLGKKANVIYAPMQPGDVEATYADVSRLVRDVGFAPATSLEVGTRRFVDWYLSYIGRPQSASSK